MTQETEAKIACVMLALEVNQRLGTAPPPGDPRLTPEYLARVAETIGLPVSASTFRQIEQDALRKLQLTDLALEALTHLHRRPA